ncbi:aquaporin-like protein [Fimicolochytrium jonesii]|uniref:aquaporin-like protein n=1 Tax=Fimicolochytrium jonesii TaxID=1396493 RepID=UPI0022FDD6F4|nr:aquaporin-like protein [Fimicolochytrium jonesii]KAI8816972.1 aquaporin-like protein [Fimicolochytrium jonesii]
MTKFAKSISTLLEPMPGATNVPRARKWRALVAEFIGTMLFVFFVAGSVAVPSGLKADPVASLLFIGLTQGLALAVFVSVSANISGGHLNPAVTLALLVARAVSPITALLYIIAQMLGAVAGAGLYLATMGTAHADHLGITTPTNFDGGNVYLFEFILTSVLMLVVFATAVHGSIQGHVVLAPIPIGMTLVIANFLAANFTGASLNPARTFGPAVVASAYSDVAFAWREQHLYWLAQLSAAVVVGVLYKMIYLSAPATKAQVREAGLLGNSAATVQGMSEAELIRRSARDEAPAIIDIPDIPEQTSPRSTRNDSLPTSASPLVHTHPRSALAHTVVHIDSVTETAAAGLPRRTSIPPMVGVGTQRQTKDALTETAAAGLPRRTSIPPLVGVGAQRQTKDALPVTSAGSARSRMPSAGIDRSVIDYSRAREVVRLSFGAEEIRV